MARAKRISSAASKAAAADTGGTLTIDLAAIAANWQALARQLITVECAAVVKANAYGLGLKPVVAALSKAGCKTFFVADVAEARIVRSQAKQATIYVLHGFTQDGAESFVELAARPVINSMTELAEWDALVAARAWQGGAALHVDTGMNRLGLTLQDAHGIVPRIHAGDHGITLVMSHLACAENPQHPLNARQLTNFREIAQQFTGVPASLANSSGCFLGPQFQFDLLRPGAALYGVNPTPEADNPMRPVVDLKTRIIQVREVERGDTVGYGATWTARRPTRLAIVSTGYADGYFRAAGSTDGTRSADVIVAGKRCPIAGRISMDLIAVDITDLPEKTVRRGHMVTLLGDGITVDELGHHFGTIGYEVLTSLGHRYTRVYKGEGR
ncbi:MAG: alanine racemase [Xanthobacteraceae bacterium]